MAPDQRIAAPPSMADDRARARRYRRFSSYRALLAAGILGPLLLFAAIAWWTWERVSQEVDGDISRTADMLHEHAERLVQLDALLLDQIDRRLEELGWDEIARQDGPLDATLASITAQVADVDGVFVADAAGQLRLLIRGHPTPARSPLPPNTDVRDRSSYRMARDGAVLTLDGPFKSRVTGRPVFQLSRRLANPDGSFRGVAVLAVSPQRLIDFWQGIVDPGDTISLIRKDGVVIARYPELPLPADQPPLRFSQAFVDHIQTLDSGGADITSAIDGIERLNGFRKLRDLPIYIVYAVDKRNIAAQWYPTVAAFAVLTALAIGALFLTTLAVARRARGEAEALDRAEATARALRRSEEAYRLLFLKAPAAMHALDAQRHILDVNEHWLELLGYTREEVIGRPTSDFYAAGADPLHEERWQQLLQSGNLRDAEREVRTKSGEILHVLISSTLQRDPTGAFARSIAVTTDVTARRRAEAAARHERELSGLLIDSSTEGIIGIDRDFRYTLWNPAMEAMSGIPHAHLVGRYVFDRRDELIGPVVEAAWRATREGRRTALRDRPFSFSQSGRSGFYDADFAPLYGPDGAIVGGMCFVRDITEARRVEEQLRQAQKMEAVGQLTGGIAHDFNNLLTVIVGNLDLLERHVTSEMGRRLVTAARHGAERGARLTNSLLAFARRQQLRPEIVNPNHLIKEFRDLLRRAAGDAMDLQLMLSPTVHPCRLDAAQFQSALLNLVVNARDAIVSSGKITIETGNLTFGRANIEKYGDLDPGRYVVVSVTDTGIGMDEATMARAFEPFFTTKDVGKGSGLGLSQVYGFVKQSGGHVQLASEPGIGTTVRLYLPSASAPAAVEDVARTSAAAPIGGSETILVVEDDADVRAVVAESLASLGYRVIAAPDAPAALEVLKRGEPVDLVFSDVVMPGGISGDELGRLARLERRGVKVLLTSGYPDLSLEQNAEGFALLHKPYLQEELARSLREVLDRVS